MNKEEKIILLKMLSFEQPFSLDGVERTSMIIELIKSARYLSGRDIETGEIKLEHIEYSVEKNIYTSFIFSGLLNYLIFLEQLGSIIRPHVLKKTKHAHKKNSYGILANFTDLGDEQIEVIVQLRNSLSHRFGLATENKKENNKKTEEKSYKFSLEWHTNEEFLIKEATPDWDGKFSNKLDESNTTINIKNLLDLIEELFSEIIEKLKNDELEFNLKYGIDELFSRYAVK